MATHFDYPYHFDHRFRTASTTDAEHVRDMIEMLLLTDPGERVNRPDFGGGLRQLVFAPNSPELAAALQFTVRAALQRWLGDVVEVQELEVNAVDSQLTIQLQYALRATQESFSAQFVRPI
ncbi:MAG: GPW/gp25 family protein [Bryobacterales bacterium]|nr:GPW/gp25 family protein [Bryobacterales bacterium]